MLRSLVIASLFRWSALGPRRRRWQEGLHHRATGQVEAAAEAESAAKAAGYEVRRSKIEGACYEVYAVKDGKNLELFYNPIDLKLMHTVTK